MDIEKYIRNKANVRVYKLVDDDDLIHEFDSCAYESIDSLDNYKKNTISDDELVIIIADLDSLTKSDIFNKNYSLNNIMLLISNDDKFKQILLDENKFVKLDNGINSPWKINFQ